MHKIRRALFTALIFSTVLPLTSCARFNHHQSDKQQATSVEKAQSDATQLSDAAVTPPQHQTEKPQSLPHNVQEQNGANPVDINEQVPGPQNDYTVKSFFADYKKYTLGDIVPQLYRTKPYDISDYKVRHLPAPQPDSHWTYMGGNYVLISNAEGKILQVKAGEIFYH